MENQFGMKELYDACIKPTYSMDINGKTFAAGEVVAMFDKISLANFQEVDEYVSARGGYGNKQRIIWRTTQEIDLQFYQGVFNKTQFALMNNARALSIGDVETFEVSQREYLESNENKQITLSHSPIVDNGVFIYNKNTGELFTKCIQISDKVIQIPTTYTDVIVDYEFNCDSGETEVLIGQEVLSGFLSFEGRTRVKDEITGKTKTGIIKIPKLKVTSNLSMTLGTEASPINGSFSCVGLPVGEKGEERVMEIYFLDEDIDSDF